MKRQATSEVFVEGSVAKRQKRKQKLCENGGCMKRPYFNVEGQKIGRFCVQHKEVGMMDVVSRKCENGGCMKRPCFNVDGQKIGRFCAVHKEVGMMNVMSRKCENCGCMKRPRYNVDGQKTGRFCVQHKEPHMVNVVSCKCENGGCKKQPWYNVEGQKTGRFCVQHKEPRMVNVVSFTCANGGCRKQPWYNVDGQKRGRFCADHREAGMVDVKHATCEFYGCTKQPRFNIEGQKTGVFCTTHKSVGMMDVKSRKCGRNGCMKRPSYNVEGQKTGRFCATHKEPDMVNVVNPRCEHPKCKGYARYGFPGYVATFCTRHKKDHPGVILKPSARCGSEGCTDPALYGPSGIPVHCEAHHDAETEFNLVERACSSCGLTFKLDLATQRCEYCSPELFKRVHLQKQTVVKQLFDSSADLGAYVSYDRQVDGGACGKERPDFLFDCGSRFVVVEVDEHQHRSNPCECEQTRMVNIAQGLGLPTVFVRYNPDPFKDALNTKQELSYRVRHDWLERVVRRCLDTSIPNASFLEAVYLFFDGHDMTGACEPHVLIPFDKNM
jgi:hypothetical protein